MVKKGKSAAKFKITPQHRRLVQFYIKTGNVSEAGRLAKFNPSYARDLITRPAIANMIRKAEEKAGLTDDLLLKTHVDLLKNPEGNIRLGALRLGYQVKKKIGSDEGGPISTLPPAIIIIRDSNAIRSETRKERIHVNSSPDVSIRRSGE